MIFPPQYVDGYIYNIATYTSGMSSTQATSLLSKMSIIDGEVHTGESRTDLMEYLPEDIRQDEEDGYAFAPEQFGPIPWDGWDRSAGGRIDFNNYSVPNAEDFDEKREQFGIDKTVFSPGPAFRISLTPDHRTRVAYMRAYNGLVTDRFALGNGTYYAKMIALAEHPEESAEEIERIGGEDGIVGIFITDTGPTEPLGHKRHYPIFEAAEKHDLPIILHSTTGVPPAFPAAGMNPKTFLEYHTLSHPVAKMWHATSIVARGIPEKFDIDFGFWEAGFSWIQLLANRMDREYIERPNEAPGLERLPSEYLSDFYYGTQPLEEPRDPEHLQTIIDMNELNDQLIYTTDFPHMDFDAPRAITAHEGLSEEQKRKILGENAERLFGI
jgi:predicted TIM-barrel fold metal-dependent hydrolase